MTYEEAIKQLKWYFEEDNGGTSEPKTKEAYRIAVTAIEKQILKKPRFVDDDHGGRIRCPACHATTKTYNVDKPYCPDCGQHLDWNEHSPSRKIIEYLNRGELPPLSIPNAEQDEFGLQRIK